MDAVAIGSTMRPDDSTPTVSSVDVPSTTWSFWALLQKIATWSLTTLSVAFRHVADADSVRSTGIAVDAAVVVDGAGAGVGAVVGTSDAGCCVGVGV